MSHIRNPMSISISNDNGYESRGLKVLARESASCGEAGAVAQSPEYGGTEESSILPAPARVWRSWDQGTTGSGATHRRRTDRRRRTAGAEAEQDDRCHRSRPDSR